ncbi:hypothetical protein [Arthrobacter sp. MMS18-M83]|uniref:hypothetical protein n=1 Tax=Arthrobacter sp. MMS18-M83 TaxID=2996261 RepID=UPI00227C6E2C|nr:hypothetical protein [Arthrobacter sp. MMS18-M83]WAH97238.1 hypothetical protein OW521_23340 [Arthrobacter sp. MMS18-M83]
MSPVEATEPASRETPASGTKPDDSSGGDLVLLARSARRSGGSSACSVRAW